MSWLTESKEFYQKKEYEECFGLLYKNSKTAKKYVWNLILLSFLLTGISFYLDYLMSVLNDNLIVFGIFSVAVSGMAILVIVPVASGHIIAFMNVIAITLAVASVGKMFVSNFASEIVFMFVLTFAVFVICSVMVIVGIIIFLPFICKKIIENVEKK